MSEAENKDKKKVTRPRAGDWTPIKHSVPIPGTSEVFEVDFWRVEFSGEEFEVPATMEGRRQAARKINAIKEKKAERLEIARIRTRLIELRDKASTEEIREMFRRAAAAFGEE